MSAFPVWLLWSLAIAFVVGLAILACFALGLRAMRRFERECEDAEVRTMRQRQQLGRPGWRRRA